MPNFGKVRSDLSVNKEELFPLYLGENGEYVFYLRHVRSKKSQDARREAEAPYQGIIRQKARQDEPLPPDVSRAIAVEHIANGIIADWEGITEDDGSESECTPENIKELIGGEDMEDLQMQILEESQRSSNFKNVQEFELGKNSSASE